MSTIMNKKRMAIMLAVSAVVFGGVLGFVQFRSMMIKDFFANMPRPVIAVTAEPAQDEQWQASVPAVGTLRAVNGVDIAASVAGLVREITFQSGQMVERGQVLLRLDTEVEIGEMHSAQAEADLARLTADRQRALVRSDSVSKAALDKAEAELKISQARAQTLRARVDKKVIVAPFDGVLGLRQVDLGQFLQAGEPIVNLQDLSVMLADFTVSQRDLDALNVGGALRLTTDSWPGQVFEGVVHAIEPQVDPRTGMIAVQGRFDNDHGKLRPGMFARIEMVIPQVSQVVTVPVSAITYNLHGDSVFVIRDGENDQRQAERVFVELGDRRDDRIIVRSGITAGDLVVTSGQVKLESGAPVTIGDNAKLTAKAR